MVHSFVEKRNKRGMKRERQREREVSLRKAVNRGRMERAVCLFEERGRRVGMRRECCVHSTGGLEDWKSGILAE